MSQREVTSARVQGFALGAGSAAVAGGAFAALVHPSDWTWLAGAVAEGAVTAALLVGLARHLRLAEHDVDRVLEAEASEERACSERAGALQAIADSCPRPNELGKLGPGNIGALDGLGAVPSMPNGKPDFDQWYPRAAPLVVDHLHALTDRLDRAANLWAGETGAHLRAVRDLNVALTQRWRGWQSADRQRRPRLAELRTHVEAMRHHFDRRDPAQAGPGSTNLPGLVARLEDLAAERRPAVPDSADA
ncbi:MAG TPA: hypothetical protein VNQ33_09710 [Acidimicrobiales bacterium]|nr:hypothetical protein [Acidimicrobiales bacterium]